MNTRKLGIFFSHPTQHHSPLFSELSRRGAVRVKVYYFDAGALGAMLDPGFGTREPWDVDLLRGADSRILSNWLKGVRVDQRRQFNPAIPGIILREQFDAVFVSGYVSPSNWLAMSVAKLTGTRVFYQSDTSILDEQRKRRSPFKRAFRGAFLSQVDAFFAIGDHNWAAYRSFGIDAQRIHWCPIPVDRARFANTTRAPALPGILAALRLQYEIPEHARVVALSGKLIARKRPEDLINAVRLLGRSDVYCLLIGSGALEHEIRSALNSEDRVRITGFVNQQMIPYHMLLADVGVVCSEWDPHPLVTTEFAMCGLPLIVSDKCGVWGPHDILRPGENGFTYPCGDVPQLASTLAQLLDDDALRARMGRRSLELSESQSIEAAAAAIERVLLE